MGFKLKSGNKPKLSRGVLEPKVDLTIAVVTTAQPISEEGASPMPKKEGAPYHKNTPYYKATPYKEDDDDEDDSNEPEEVETETETQTETEVENETPEENETETETEEQLPPGVAPPEDDKPAGPAQQTPEEKADAEAKEQADRAEREEQVDSYMQEHLGITPEEVSEMKETTAAKEANMTETEKIEESVKSDSEKMEEARQEVLEKEAKEEIGLSGDTIAAENKAVENTATKLATKTAIGATKGMGSVGTKVAKVAGAATRLPAKLVEKTAGVLGAKGIEKGAKLVGDKLGYGLKTGVKQAVLKGAEKVATATGMDKKLAAKVLSDKGTKYLAGKAAMNLGGKFAAKAALRFVPGVGQILMARDAIKLGAYAFKNRDKIAGWAMRQKNNMRNKLNEWQG